MNLLMCAPLRDSRGAIKYFIGAQVDVSGLVKDCSDFESLKRVADAADQKECGHQQDEATKDEFRELSEMFNGQELETVRKWGGTMHGQSEEGTAETNGHRTKWLKRRLLLHDETPDGTPYLRQPNGKLSGIYENYLLVRPYPSLRILFASASFRLPGILQSSFMARIGGTPHVKEELTQAFASGQGVTANVRWVTKYDPEGRSRWIHCTPLLGSNGAIGVWMIVIVDDEYSGLPCIGRQVKEAPPTDHAPPYTNDDKMGSRTGENGSLRSFASQNGTLGRMDGSVKGLGSPYSHHGSADRGSPDLFRI